METRGEGRVLRLNLEGFEAGDDAIVFVVEVATARTVLTVRRKT